jgi:hypothetical protein
VPRKRVEGIARASGADDLTNRSPVLAGLFSKQIELMQLSEIRGEHSLVRDIETVLNRPPFPLPPSKCLPREIVRSLLECMPLLIMKREGRSSLRREYTVGALRSALFAALGVVLELFVCALCEVQVLQGLRAF